MKKALLLGMLLASPLFSQEIIFKSPYMGIDVDNSLTIQVAPITANVKVHVWIENKENLGRIVWKSALLPKQKYVTELDVSSFKEGSYILRAEAYVGTSTTLSGKTEFFIKR